MSIHPLFSISKQIVIYNCGDTILLGIYRECQRRRTDFIKMTSNQLGNTSSQTNWSMSHVRFHKGICYFRNCVLSAKLPDNPQNGWSSVELRLESYRVTVMPPRVKHSWMELKDSIGGQVYPLAVTLIPFLRWPSLWIVTCLEPVQPWNSTTQCALKCAVLVFTVLVDLQTLCHWACAVLVFTVLVDLQTLLSLSISIEEGKWLFPCL